MNIKKTGLIVFPIVAAMAMAGADAPATAPKPAAAPAATQPAGKALTVTFVAVDGMVQYRPAPDKPWEFPKPGQVVGVGGEIRTGPHGSVKFKIPPDQVITLDRLSNLTLLQAIQNDGRHVTTDMGMKYGRTHYDVEGGDEVEHATTVRSASATLSMRGSEKFTFFDQRPWPASASGRNTSINFSHFHSPYPIHFGHKGDNSNQTVDEGDHGPVDHRHHDRVVDPGERNARSDADNSILGNYELYSGEDNNSSGVALFRGLGKANSQVPQPPAGGGGCHCGGD